MGHELWLVIFERAMTGGAMVLYRFSNGRIAEFWMLADMMSLFGQLKG